MHPYMIPFTLRPQSKILDLSQERFITGLGAPQPLSHAPICVLNRHGGDAADGSAHWQPYVGQVQRQRLFSAQNGVLKCHGVLMLVKAVMLIHACNCNLVHKGFAQDGGEFDFDASFVCCDPDCHQVDEPCEAAWLLGRIVHEKSSCLNAWH